MGNHGITDRFEGQPKLAKWWATINANPTLKPALDEIHETVRKFRQQREAEAATKKRPPVSLAVPVRDLKGLAAPIGFGAWSRDALISHSPVG